MMTPDELWYGMLNEVKKKIPSTMYSTWIESSLILVSYEIPLGLSIIFEKKVDSRRLFGCWPYSPYSFFQQGNIQLRLNHRRDGKSDKPAYQKKGCTHF